MMSKEWEVGGIYHNCRWCRFNDKGKCVKSSEVFDSPVVEQLYTIAESGKLSGAIEEGLTFPKWDSLKSLLVEYGISQKRQREILQAVGAEMENFTPTLVQAVDENVSKLIMSMESDLEDLELSDPESFYCKYFE